ncbi:hypothetical protein CROQUDRAFT_664798 [Cronartium quercuum f. sp. fusiforme G11]|uniref:DDE Tnp4 domain-containing protein n=1 Tax=Cronartium quercuum f. sp. fusiforme G11 TaxID=708437 RepID=A0A9P6NAG4_9BASI|nr:hypothetical protein CROQUDRAFT_664798 [Cronartium quercuum f. sp. fusiforme G11]
MLVPAFTNLVKLIEKNPVFHNNSTCDQVPVWWQTLVTLANLGTSGKGGDHFHLARMFNCSEGSIQNWSKRVIESIIDLEPNYLCWPSPTERQVLKSQIEQSSFFRDCVGFVDGTFIPLASAPHKWPEDYWTQKAFYAYNMILVCDINQRIIYYELGWCGSAHDQRVFRSSQLFQHPTVFFH